MTQTSTGETGTLVESVDAAIAIRDLTYRWPKHNHDVLDIPQLSIQRGRRVFVRGASGSGKTTLLSLIGAIIQPVTGSIHVDGLSLNSLSGGERDTFRANHIGFVFQMFNLLPFLGLIDNVLLPCRFSSERRARAQQDGGSLEAEAHRLLESLGLNAGALADRPVSQLSVGQQQRVAAARALIGRPSIIVADEPTSALDADTRHSFLELLFNEVAATDATLVFVSHDRELEGGFDDVLDLARINLATALADDGGTTRLETSQAVTGRSQ